MADEFAIVRNIIKNFGIGGEITDNGLYQRIAGWGSPDDDPEAMVEHAMDAGVLVQDAETGLYSLAGGEEAAP